MRDRHASYPLFAWVLAMVIAQWVHAKSVPDSSSVIEDIKQIVGARSFQRMDTYRPEKGRVSFGPCHGDEPPTDPSLEDLATIMTKRSADTSVKVTETWVDSEKLIIETVGWLEMSHLYLHLKPAGTRWVLEYVCEFPRRDFDLPKKGDVKP